MNAFNNHTTTVAPAKPLPAHLVITSLASELHAAGEVLNALHHFAPMAALLHAKADLKERGVIDQDLKRNAERAAVLSMSRQYLAQHRTTSPRAAASRDLARRLRTVAGQSMIKPPDIDIEAADHIERLVLEIERLTRADQSSQEITQ
ncbi:hypothetical protein GM658_12440 [Pseudoduganella eburnea]|uniref:Uncharacterized protein n=1 Tax=Massilia eburnea TaxID=1776165 RepID=A0A6L6QGR7_9BURK|nr:hypothetical protein [Massilia eburnea]MTW11405.1 hypothetical protein [Massilia eburnea]